VCLTDKTNFIVYRSALVGM